MLKKIKKIIKKCIGKQNIFCMIRIKYICDKTYNNHKFINILKTIQKTKFYSNSKNKTGFSKLVKNIKIKDLKENENFYYNIDMFSVLVTPNEVMGNFCIDYSLFIENSLEELKNKISSKNNDFYMEELELINGIEIYLDRIIEKLKISKKYDVITNLENIKNCKAQSYTDALQRILFFNMLLWQTNHRLNGLGRLDKILIDYYDYDIKNGLLTKEKAKELLKEFLIILHRDFKIKSNVLLGDTGQIIEVGGIDINNNYLCNDLTYLFIELMEELKLPDPKVLVRASKYMPKELISESLKCILTGIGCPIFANDDVIIDKLINFGYDKEAAYNYGTSACWEPYIIGMSSAQNNIGSLNFMQPFIDLLENEDLSKFNNLDDLIDKYQTYLKKFVENLVLKINEITFEKDSLLSLCIANCVKDGKDISLGGAKYNNFGLTGVGLANVVNSMINIDEFIFKKNIMSFEKFNDIRKENFKNNDELLKKLKSNGLRYGEDNDMVVSLANKIICYTSKILENKRNSLNGKFKFGVSSPNYISDSKNFPASFDGRKIGEPFSVHISTDKSNGYTELVNFASRIDYNFNRFNGNVVDFFVTPNFIKDNFDKFIDFLIASIKVGFFEMQMNVVSSKKLIEARKNPDKFPNLVVRVWGFSAYFKDLPDEYKDYLIERALKNEGAI